MKVVNIAQRTPEWYPWRRQGITGTDAAALLGLHDEKTQWLIWAEKLGKVPPKDISKNPHVKRGVAQEPIARQAVEEKYGIMLLPFCGEYDEYPILRASFDGIAEDGRPHEIKCPCDSVWEDLQANKEKSPNYTRHQCQCQHQLLVSGADSMLLIYFHNGELLEFTINRDEAMIQEIINKAKQFWPFVVTKKEPPKDPLKDVYVPRGKKRGDWLTLASDRKRATTFLREAETRVQTLKGQLKQNEEALVKLMGKFNRAECDGVAITRFMQQGPVDYKKLIADLFPDVELTEELLNRYRGEPSARTRITETETEEAEQQAAAKRRETGEQPQEEASLPASVYNW